MKRGVLIGCGFFARNHMNAWAGLDGVKIVAVCDIELSKAEAMARDFNVPAFYTDAGKMLDETKPDFADIATTSSTHRMLAEAAAIRKVAAICQKPFADSFADAEAMVAACAKANVPLIVHENFRWQRAFTVMKEMIDAGEIGTPHFGRFTFRHGYDNYKNQPYLAEIERFTIMDVGLHLFDLARHFMGDVASLSCNTQRLNSKVRGEDAFTALLNHGNGSTSICDCSFQSHRNPEPFPQTLAEIEGPKGTFILDADYKLTLHNSKGRTLIEAAPAVPSWGGAPWHAIQDSVIRFQAHVLQVLNGKTHPQPSGADNLKTLALALAAYEAAENKSTIDMKSWKEAIF
ncbi:MAG: Gfo/Idh/MocA family protein [Notoacmeibacter sp.]